jgi:hypothetical protein
MNSSRQHAPARSDDRCHDCGAIVADGRKGCQQLFDEVIAKEFANYRFASIHRLTVDTYALQHPMEYMRSGKSFAAHLTGVCAALERTEAAAEINRAVQKWLDGPKTLERPPDPPPRRRGTITIVHVHSAADVEQHVRRVREWAQSTWEAWASYQALARKWIEMATVARSTVQ